VSTAMLAPSAAKSSTRSAAEITEKSSLRERARALLRPDMTPCEYLAALIRDDHLVDAADFLAHMLPKPEAVWWGIQCARSAAASPEDVHPTHIAALAVAEKWLQDPSEQNRRAALSAAQDAGMGRPAGLVAIGVFFSGGSLAPASVPTVPAGEHLTAAMIAGAVIQAAYQNCDDGKERLKAFLTKGSEVANGLSRWPPKK
jgi:hypothetical protein